jgi:lipoprotein-anchoring transpeptidase ErfK/SrfK
MKTPGYLPDGMYYSNFFHTGYAIHGYDPSPTYPASHGCLRLPIDDAINATTGMRPPRLRPAERVCARTRS